MATQATYEFHTTLGALGIARVAQLFGVGPRSVRRWRDGDRRVPRGVDILVHLLATGATSRSIIRSWACFLHEMFAVSWASARLCPNFTQKNQNV